jgi:uncharacterized membrane protein
MDLWQRGSVGPAVTIVHVADDGEVVVGESRVRGGPADGLGTQRAFRWTRETGSVPLGLPGGVSPVTARVDDATPDASVVVGAVTDQAPTTHSSPPNRIYRWTEATGMVALVDFDLGVATVSEDGSTVVISSDYQDDPLYRWTEETGLEVLGPLGAGGIHSVAALSADGSTLYGTASTESLGMPYRWSTGSGMRPLEMPDAWENCTLLPRSMTSHGSALLGSCRSPSVAFVYTDASGVVEVPAPTGYDAVSPASVSTDANVVMGVAMADDVGVAFRYTSDGGSVALPALEGQVAIYPIWPEGRAGMSADGSVAAGLWDAEFDQYGYRWGAATGMVDLLPPAGLTRSYPLAVGSDGSWTLGYARLEDNEAILNAVLWDSTATPHVFAERLGIDLGEIVLAQAIGFTSAKDIVGYADEGGVGSLTRGFLARLDE